MPTTTSAYSITAEAIAAETEACGGDLSKINIARVIRPDELELRDLGGNDVRLRILAISAEHNIIHAALADTVNIAELRGGKLYPGNSAVAEVLEVGGLVSAFLPGDIVVTQGNGDTDRYGYPRRIWAYDQPGSVGWYSKEAVVGDWQIIKAPIDCGLTLWEMAALPGRAPSAYHLWRRGMGIFRVKVSYEHKPRLNVLAFGGGTSELFLMLAAAEGHNAFYCAGSAERRAALEARGIAGIDQKVFNRFRSKADIAAFAATVKNVTDGDGMHIVCDLFRGPVFDAGLAAAARCGVNVSAGWQLSQVVQYNSTIQSVKQVTIDHTHHETVAGCYAASELYGSVFKPIIHDEVYGFDDLPRCFQEMHANTQTGIPIVRVADELPGSLATQHQG